MKMIEVFTYLSEMFAGHPVSTFQPAGEIPNEENSSEETFDENIETRNEGIFLSQDMVTRRGGFDRHFLA